MVHNFKKKITFVFIPMQVEAFFQTTHQNIIVEYLDITAKRNCHNWLSWFDIILKC